MQILSHLWMCNTEHFTKFINLHSQVIIVKESEHFYMPVINVIINGGSKEEKNQQGK